MDRKPINKFIRPIAYLGIALFFSAMVAFAAALIMGPKSPGAAHLIAIAEIIGCVGVVILSIISLSFKRRNGWVSLGGWAIMKDLMRGNPPVPPLPSVPIHGMTTRYWDQTAVDRILREIYLRRPELFAELARLDGANTGREPLAEYRSMDAISGEFVRMGGREFGVMRLASHTQLFWEARRRARVMYGLHT